MNQDSGFVRSFLRLSIVNVLSNLMVPLAGIVDVAFLGHLSEIRHLAGVSLATVLFNYIYWTFGFLRMGTTGMTAQAIGRKDETEALAIGLRHALIALVIGVLILLLQAPLRTIGFALLSATPEVKAAGQDYFHALIWGAPATLINFVLMGWYLGRGQSGKVLLLSAVSNGSNIVLDYFFVGQWGWASAGAGWSTALSQYLMLLIGLGLISREFRGRDLQKVTKPLWERSALGTVFSLNRDILVRTFVLVSTFALFTNLSSAFGTEVLATNTVLLQVVTLTAYFIDGFAFATESYAGLFRGQGTVKGLTRLLRIAGYMSLAVGLLFAIAFILLPLPLFGLITDHRAILDRIPQYVVWLLPVLGFGSIAYMLDGYFLGLTEGPMLRRAAVISTLVGFVPMALVAWWLRSSHLLWLALTLFMLARSITLAIKVPQTLKDED
ncbi:guanitoxin biosynthesis MATE family efflux transporter GntT [Leptolyngbya sp. FACHB-711]|uniref:guanitoxin biosynthesis MATE family efflux transporter GntT n=1 Tax=unclassified Leptolyngbya TaxID=2650499 RepID=UPI0018EFA936|nr:guanitoxin biosynthesis MATE family efflux transporter GntT [Leptolyngbya sp. FACHB-711]